MTLAEALARRDRDTLAALRLALAVAVVVSHAWPLALGPGTDEPLLALTGRSLGGWAVLSFFFLSGILITGSAERQPALAFWTARVRRILPGLGAALIVTLAFATLSGATATLTEMAVYLVRGLTLVSIEHQVTGAYPSNPIPGIVNGPVWSLFHEVAAYLICTLAVRSGLTRHRAGVALLVVAALVLMHIPGLPARVETFAPLFAAFACGMAVWHLRASLHLDARMFLPALLLLPFGTAAIAPALGAALLLVAFCGPARHLRADLSYGTYLYGWPVAQLIVHLLPGIGPLELALLSTLATLPLAAASWYLIEHPSLRRRRLRNLAA
jgi:peptidoglycan/LPS O-acetylase OafA/YrhL